MYEKNLETRKTKCVHFKNPKNKIPVTSKTRKTKQKHISECETYKSACETKYGIRPTDTQNRTFLLDHFKCLKSNLTNWHERTAYEGLCITQLQPTLNKQLKGVGVVIFEPLIELIYDKLISVMTKVDLRNLMVAIIFFKTI